MPDLAAAEAFIWTNARVLERHRFAHRWKAGPSEPVLAALAAYATGDGAYGHALEPDLRAPLASPAAVETALRVLAEVGALNGPLGRAAVDWLARVAPDGALPFMLPDAMAYPRAPWWQTDADPPGSLTMGGFVAGTLLGCGLDHPWLETLEAWLWAAVESARELSPYDARGALAFLDAVGDDARARGALQRLAPMVAEVVSEDPGWGGESHTPLDLSPSPGARSRVLFDAALVDAHLDHLAGAQRDDGGWTFDWMAWSEAASAEWRGIVTLRALDLMAGHGRLEQHRQHVDEEQDHRDTEQADVDHDAEHPRAARGAGASME
jgi:hypothetical protein